MKLTLDALIVLDAIKRNGSYAKAALELNRVRSALTYTMQKLENDLQVTVFERSAHRAVLTPPGEELLEEGRRLLHQAYLLETNAKRIHQGWEKEIRIAYDDLIPFENVTPIIHLFQQEYPHISLKITKEVLAGTWDAIIDGRADLAIGAAGEIPYSFTQSLKPLGEIDFLFTVAPHHPLATVPEPLASQEILPYPIITIADSSLHLPVRTSGVIDGQKTITVPDFNAKIKMQLQGIGIGYLPSLRARKYIDQGQLIVKKLEKQRPSVKISIAWQNNHKGKGTQWLLNKLQEPEMALSFFTP